MADVMGMSSQRVVPVALEDLVDEEAGGIATHLLDQQVDCDKAQFFRCSRAIGALSFRPFDLDVGIDAVAGHGDLTVAVLLKACRWFQGPCACMTGFGAVLSV
ncbi:hypothetical protein AYO28_09670 [Pseudomonas putida]|uniref:Uncharacterized protein n=1 Tax=Pseudomonas putida TaxID=303 RepID=A0A177ST65_PSEPU|nr:hypothetical protein AYO28_09670 [Pseudomonas putida]